MSSLISGIFKTQNSDGRTITVYLDAYENLLFSLDGGVTRYPAVNPASTSGLVIRVDALENAVAAQSAAIIGATTQLQGLTTRVNNLDTAVLGATTQLQGLTTSIEYLEQHTVPLLVYVTDNASTDVTMELHGGTYYKFTQPLVGLTFSSIENSHYECEVRFTGDTACRVDIPNSVDKQEDLQFEAGKTYIINVRDNLMLATAITPGT